MKIPDQYFQRLVKIFLRALNREDLSNLEERLGKRLVINKYKDGYIFFQQKEPFLEIPTFAMSYVLPPGIPLELKITNISPNSTHAELRITPNYIIEDYEYLCDDPYHNHVQKKILILSPDDSQVKEELERLLQF